MNHEELKENLREMFGECPEVITAEGIIRAMREAEVKPLPSEDDIEAACEALVDDGILQRAGREGYEATEEWIEEYQQ